MGGQEWDVDRRLNTLFVAVASEELRLFSVPAQFVKRVASQLPYPEGSYDGDFAQLLIEQYNGGDLDTLKNLLSPANTPAEQSRTPQ